MKQLIKIGTRESKLAVVQAQLVADAITTNYPEIKVELVTMKTTGDKILDRTLDKIGGKGLFVKELDEALARGDVDICAHSYKDVPAEDNPDFPIVATGVRENPRDVLILPQNTDKIDPEKPIGCMSRRRQIQLGELYPNQPLKAIRGNVITRLAKLDSGEYSAVVLAYAGVTRLDLDSRISRVFDTGEILPAGCQGVIAVQGRKGEDYSYLSGFHNADSRDCTEAERAFVRTLACGCGAPVAAYAIVNAEVLTLRAMVLGKDSKPYFDEICGSRADAGDLGAKLAKTMVEKSGFHAG